MTHAIRRTRRTSPKCTITKHTKNLNVAHRRCLPISFCGPTFFFTQNLFWTLFFGPKIFFRPKIFFGSKMFFRPKNFFGPKFFWTKVYFRPNFLDLELFQTQTFFRPKFRTQNFFWPKMNFKENYLWRKQRFWTWGFLNWQKENNCSGQWNDCQTKIKTKHLVIFPSNFVNFENKTRSLCT